MKYHPISLLAFAVSVAQLHAQWATQQIHLNPGWNAVFLEVHPQPSDADAVFAGLPVESVWEWNRNGSPVEFIQDPVQLIPKLPEWATWFPESSPTRVVANLFDIRGGRALLIKLGGTASVTWNASGVPATPTANWAPDSFSLTGFFVKSSGAPTFANYFASSPAHTGQQIYSLNAQGKWVFTSATTGIVRGKAYWIRTNGASSFLGPVEVGLERAAGIDFGTILEQAEVILTNRNATGSQTVTLALGPSGPRPPGADTYPPLAGPVLLYYKDFAQPSTETALLPEWQPLSQQLSFTIAAGGSKTLHLATRRGELPTPTAGDGDVATYQGLIEVAGSGGTRQSIPVTIQRGNSSAAAPGAAEAVAGEGAAGGSGSATHPRAGLWVGSATVSKVNWLGGVSNNVVAANPDFNGTDRQTPRDTASEFPLRVIIHVDGSGNARLLQKVIQVWENGTLVPDENNSGLFVTGEPGKFRLFSNDQAANAFRDSSLGTGATLRNGVPVPRRFSTIAYPIRTPLDMAGTFGTGDLAATVVISYDDPLNPFKHAFHPQHDNKDARFDATLPPNVESYSVSRAVRLEFSASPPPGGLTPGWGDSEMRGAYHESITGIHRDPINVSGTFLLRRVSGNAMLD